MILAALRWNRRAARPIAAPPLGPSRRAPRPAGPRTPCPARRWGRSCTLRRRGRRTPVTAPRASRSADAGWTGSGTTRSTTPGSLAPRAGPRLETAGCERTPGTPPRSFPARRRARPPASPSTGRPRPEAPRPTRNDRGRRGAADQEAALEVVRRAREQEAAGVGAVDRHLATPAAPGLPRTRAGARCARTDRSSRRRGPPARTVSVDHHPGHAPVGHRRHRSTTTPSSQPHVVQRARPDDVRPAPATAGSC